MKKLLLVLMLGAIAGSRSHAQIIPPGDTIPAIINPVFEENGAVKFGSQLRPLRPIAGAPAPFYTYFWEFGDGTFSFEQAPVHVYPDTGKYQVRLFATNNYDDGKRPPTRPKPIVGKGAKTLMAAAPVPGFFKDGSIGLKSNCMPKPGDDMMLVLGYRNKNTGAQRTMSGTFAILYNDKEFSANNFDLPETRTYHNETKTDLHMMSALTASTRKQQEVYYASIGETVTGAQLEQMVADAAKPVMEEMKNFKSSQAWHFDNLKAGEERYAFLHFKTTPEMIKDTNAVVRLSAVFVPDDPLAERGMFNMELQIVASHDPNKMSIRKTRMNYRLTGKHRELTYRVRFQNTGKGPAKKVDVEVSLSPVFDPATISVSKTKPEVKPCDGAYSGQSCLQTVTDTGSVHFVFTNIYLPGTQQDGVHDADSTMGFVEYKIRFREKPPKLPIYTSAAIVFDKNEPIRTNRAAGKFKMGLSPGVILGYGFPFSTDNSQYITQKNVVIGGSLAPYSPYKKFVQIEAYLASFREASQTTSVAANKDTTIGKNNYRITNRTLQTNNKVVTLNVVPISLRYNLNNYIGVGAGALVAIDLTNDLKRNVTYSLIGANGVANTDYQASADKVGKSFSDFRASVFADVVLGMVRVGPSVGLRYFYDPKSSVSRASTYVTWKF